MVFAPVEPGGEARTAVVASKSALALDPLMFKWFDRDAVLCTDELATDQWFGSTTRRHYPVTHSVGEYARAKGTFWVHPNTTKGFFGLFKSGIRGIHHWVSARHLHRYVTEHEFRYNSRAPDAGKRITAGRLRLRELFV